MSERRARLATNDPDRVGAGREIRFHSPQIVMFGLGDAGIESHWSCALKAWGITCASYDTLPELLPVLDETALILCDPMQLEPDLFSHFFSACLRKHIPIIAVGAEIDARKRVEILELGVDDCLESTCSGRELIARIRAILRRRQTAPARKPLRFAAGWTIDTGYRKALGPDGETIPLTGVEFGLLKIFLEFPERIFTADELSEATRTMDFHPSALSISRAICRLRIKLTAGRPQAQLIQTIQNRGYRWSNNALQ